MANIDRRAHFGNELLNPDVVNWLLCMTEAEVGGQGVKAQTAFMETIFNRAMARNQSLWVCLHTRYFPNITYSRARASLANIGYMHKKYDAILQNVLDLSNFANGGTGNASENVGFGRNGYLTASFNGEKFGVEEADLAWAKSADFVVQP